MFRTAVLIGALYFLCYSTCQISAMTPEQMKKIHDHFEVVGMECINEYPIPEADIEKFRNKEMGTGDNAPCFLACIMKKVGLMDDKGMLQKESALELAKTVFDNDEEEIKNIADYLHSCAHINTVSVEDGEKGCDRAKKSFSCMKENAGKFGFDL